MSKIYFFSKLKIDMNMNATVNYPHIIQENVLPQDLYDSLKTTLPAIDSFGS